MKKTISIFGGLCAVVLLLLQLEKWSLFTLGGSENLLMTISGILFLFIGIVISRYFYVRVESGHQESKRSSLSKREVQVLQLMSKGLSNKEIADQLYIAETTVKSHVSKILNKLGAKRRTEAVMIGQNLDII